mgnify:CR=1 FL=1
MNSATRSEAAAVSHPAGRLEWRPLLRWLQEDGVIDAETAQRVEQALVAQAERQAQTQAAQSGATGEQTGLGEEIAARLMAHGRCS